MRTVVAVVVGAGIAAIAAVIFGDYPLSGSVPWLAAVIVPGVIGVPMAALDRRHRAAMWAVAGPLAAGSLAWGVRIATGWGLDPVPAAAWAAIFIGLSWPVAWSIFSRARASEPASPRPT